MQEYKDIIKTKTDLRNQRLIQAHNLYNFLLNNTDFYENERLLKGAALESDETNIKHRKDIKTKIVTSLGISMNDLEPTVDCKICHDTCFHDGKMCSCVIQHISHEFWVQHKFLQNTTFENLDIKFYTNDNTKMQTLVQRLKTLCTKFPNTNSISILLSGNTGTGKTYLAGCVANQLLSQNHNVVFVTAMQFVQSMTKYHTTFDDTKDRYFSPYIDCDMLIIDDLGTESMFNNITIDYLYLVISQRLASKKHIFITTNLSKHELEQRYGMRIASRLYDKQLCFAYHIDGKDNRIIG